VSAYSACPASQLLRLQVANTVQRALALAAARREGRSPIEEDASPLGQPHRASGAAGAPRLPSMCASVAGRLLLCMDRLWGGACSARPVRRVLFT